MAKPPYHDSRTDKARRSHLYRRSLKLSLDWSIHRYLWRGQALYIRSLFEANKHVSQPRQQRVCLPPNPHSTLYGSDTFRRAVQG